MNILWQPNPGPQTMFLQCQDREVFYGGSAGAGKTEALIALMLRDAWHPKHRAILLRRTRPQLQEVIDRCIQLIPAAVPGTVWQETRQRFELPNGGFIRLGHAEHENTIYKYKTDEFNLICFDELTSFTEKQYLFMFSRNRTKALDLPPLMRSASNPGDIGHAWVAKRFITYKKPFEVHHDVLDDAGIEVITRRFIPARVYDNPRLPNAAAYIAGLKAMGPEMAAAYLDGNWQVFEGAMFSSLPQSVPAQFHDRDYYIIRAFDWGWNDSTCVYHLAVYPDGLVDIIHELYVDHCTISQVAHLVREYEQSHNFKSPRFSVGGRDMFNTEGTSGTSLATMLQQRGVWVERANDDRKAGWQLMLTLLEAGRLRVWSGRAPNLLRTLLTLQRDQNKPDDLKAKGQEDHCADALRYGLMAIIGGGQEGPVITPPPERDPNRDYKFEEIMNRTLRGQSQDVIFDGLGEGW